MEVAAQAEVDADVGRFFEGAEEDEVTEVEGVEVVEGAGDCRCEGFLLVGIAGNLDPLAEECRLHQAGAVVVRGDRTAPEVFVGNHQGGLAEVDNGGDARADLAMIEGFWRGWRLAGGEVVEVVKGEEAGVVVFEGADGEDSIL